MRRRIGRNKKKVLVVIAVFVVSAVFLVFFGDRLFGAKITVVSNQDRAAEQQENSGATPGFSGSPFSGIDCPNKNKRAFAVVLANDPVVRPLSGLNKADMILEIPVITGSITRIMAVFNCELPEEIGSLRSARHDFVPLALGLDAVLVHWGGSHFALDALKTDILDHIDAMVDPYNTFYRKTSKNPPHNGFTSGVKLEKAIGKKQYRSDNTFVGYDFSAQDKSTAGSGMVLDIGYAPPYDVRYEYDQQDNVYLRWRGGKKELDALDQAQVRAKNVIVMRVRSEQIEGPDYNDLDLESGGKCILYNNGDATPCDWTKSESIGASVLDFKSEKTGEMVKLVPGQTWIEMVEPYQKVTWVKI